MHRTSFLFVLGALLGAAPLASAVTITTHRDVFIQGGQIGLSENNNHGQFGGIVAGETSSNETQRSLLGFNVSPLAGQYSTINSITLTLYGRSYSGGNQTVQIYEVAASNTNWVEGTETPPSAPETGSSSWNAKLHHPTTPTAWTGGAGLGAPGAGYGRFDTIPSTTPLASLSFTTPVNPALTYIDQPFTFTFTGDLSALMNRWLTQGGGANASILMRLQTETFAGTTAEQVAFQSLHNGNTALAPRLTVEFSSIPEPSSMFLIGLGFVGVTAFRRSFKRQA